LAVSLRRLVLLHIIHQHLEAAVDASVVQIETKAADFERLPSTFVLHTWCRQNRNRIYIPEWLLEEWSITVDPTFSDAA